MLARVPTGRLVVLGEPGAGKTMLMVRLVLDLLARRASGGPVPFLASVASWDPAGQDLRDWLRARLLIDYPALASPPPIGATGSTRAAALLAAGLILPVLDGLDEIPEQVRGPAISRINDALQPGEQVVVTCRSKQYRDAVRPQGGAEVTLRGAAAIQLRPLDADAVRGYLCDDAAGPAARARWDPVLAVLGTEAPAGQALSTPLMVGLARAIYNPRPGELAGDLRDPAELCGPALADRTAVESLLFDAFIPAAYRHDPAGRWKAQDAERWLVFLARHLEYTIGCPDLAWWQLPLAIPRFTRTFAFAVGITSGVLIGLAVGALFGELKTTAVGAAAGAAIAVIFAIAGTRSMTEKSWQPRSGLSLVRPRRPNRGEVIFAVAIVVSAGIIAGFNTRTTGLARAAQVGEVIVGSIICLGMFLLVVWFGDLKAVTDLRSAASPRPPSLWIAELQLPAGPRLLP